MQVSISGCHKDVLALVLVVRLAMRFYKRVHNNFLGKSENICFDTNVTISDKKCKNLIA